jgi:hypothetical protein
MEGKILNYMGKFEEIIWFFLRLGLLWAALFAGLIYLVVPLQLITYVPWDVTLWSLLLFVVFITIIIISGRNIKNLFGVLGATLIFVGMWFIVNESLVKNDQYEFLPRIGMLGWVVLVLMSLEAIIVFFYLCSVLIQIIQKRLKIKNSFAAMKEQMIRQRNAIFVSGFILLMAGGYLIIASWPTPMGEIEIQPLDYQARFAFWGSHYHTRYTSTQIDALNRHKVIISPYTVSLDGSNATATAFIDEMNWWKTNAPNVSFLPAVLGVPGIFVWDGAVGSTALAKYIVGLVQQNNLTNIIGLSFDWESPVKASLGNVSYAPDRIRHEVAKADWQEFFDWMEIHAPDMFLSCVNYWEMAQDLVDDDFDLHVKQTFLTYELPYWDEYAPMIYRCGYRGEKPYGDVPRWDPSLSVGTTYDFYLQMREHANGVKRVHGDTSRLGVYLGITNCTCYGRDIEVWEYGEYQGSGYDMLVRDALIVKSFGAPIITLFILDTVIENGYSMGGVFESYGDDFLDRYNASVNGVNSTKSFTITKGPMDIGDNFIPDLYKNAYLDILYNLDALGFAILIYIAYVVSTGILVTQSTPKSITKKIKPNIPTPISIAGEDNEPRFE